MINSVEISNINNFLGEAIMKTILRKVRIKSFIILAIVICISFGLGYYTSGNVNTVNIHPDSVKRISTDVQKPGNMNAANSTDKIISSEDDPLIHLKMLQDDVETFKALMEEVKKELFVSGKA